MHSQSAWFWRMCCTRLSMFRWSWLSGVIGGGALVCDVAWCMSSGDSLADMSADGHRRGEPRRFKSKQMNETRHAVLRGAVDAEVGIGCAGADDFGAHAGEAREGWAE